MSVTLEQTVNQAVEGIKHWARLNSPWAIHYNSGSCNGCDIEILATLTPRYVMQMKLNEFFLLDALYDNNIEPLNSSN